MFISHAFFVLRIIFTFQYAMPVFRWHDHSRFREFMDKVTSNLNTKQRILIILQYSKLKVLILHLAFSAGNPKYEN